ncbi:polysaccharide deacetylase family protein [Virgibacillus sp. YIM 98842]|jgi:probable sporulation protein (polysaccharide deacetylase family)|uniref:polysaccharide deacetylase family protein n=1 Tax=Virgibacillus sp. YIM 98842 TaxID=2663533 RepID=UPI0013DB4918|nr:polysaccharide deacetylase family protein [Virgibacillus sp. YIM 98842]
MFRYQNLVNLFVFVIMVSLVFQAGYYPYQTIEPVMYQEATKHEDPLYREIEQKSIDFSAEPQNAYIDDVWKKTPGRNGLKVDINKSYKKMKEEGVFDASLIVYEEIKPEITLADLPAAPIYRGNPEKDMVAFLINVSWGTEHIPAILNTLKEQQVKATFFIDGKWAQSNSDYVKMIDEQGHLIGNHAYNHPDMARLSNQQVLEQITQTNEIIKAITGKSPKWFAPPSGSFNDHVVQSAHNLDMQTILWTVDTIDWKNPSVPVMVDRVKNKIHPGATVLMHPTPSIADGLDAIIALIKDAGYKIGTIENLISEER